MGLQGYIETRAARGRRHEFYRLKFGKRDSITLLTAMYPSDDVPKLERKWSIWNAYRVRNGLAEASCVYRAC